jgi:hypothetical protein
MPQAIAAHESPRMTKLYDRTGRDIDAKMKNRTRSSKAGVRFGLRFQTV